MPILGQPKHNPTEKQANQVYSPAPGMSSPTLAGRLTLLVDAAAHESTKVGVVHEVPPKPLADMATSDGDS